MQPLDLSRNHLVIPVKSLATPRVTVRGEAIVDLFDAKTGEHQFRRKFTNVITNYMLKQLCTFSAGSTPGAMLMNSAQVGTGTTVPSPADTQLAAPLASNPNNSSMGAFSFTDVNVLPLRCTRGFIWGENYGNGTLTEFGVFTGSNPSVGTLTARILFKDGSGNPTPITKTNLQIMTINYTQIWDLPAPIPYYEETVNGVLVKGTLLNSFFKYWGNYISSMNPTAELGTSNAAPVPTQTGILGTRVGTSIYGGNLVTYVEGSYERVMTWTYDLTVCNGNIGEAVIAPYGSTTYPGMRFTFDPVLVKDNTKRLTLKFGLLWSRVTA